MWLLHLDAPFLTTVADQDNALNAWRKNRQEWELPIDSSAKALDCCHLGLLVLVLCDCNS